MIRWLAHAEMELPAALLIYRPDQPKRAAYFPYTNFSPETQALRYALERDIAARFADLPQAQWLATEQRPQMPPGELFQTLAEATGRPGYEEWWNLAVEQRRDSTELFTAVLELMSALRAEAPAQAADEEQPGLIWAERREARMRQEIRRALSEGHRRVAFVCGAWHAPALLELGGEEADTAVLRGLATAVVEATWVPWTYGRLSFTSGYGAGILSPGWYDHLWAAGMAGQTARETAVGWLARVAGLLRGQDLDASAAHVIEAVRLSEALAALRGLPFPGLPELNEATVSVLSGGDREPLELIRRKLIVGERLGRVPEGTPMVPLQVDLLRLQRELELQPQPEATRRQLDLREPLDLARSHLLHRLRLLGIPWGEPARSRGGQSAALESWKLAWQPEFAVRVIEASMWGNTVEEAAGAWAADAATQATALAELTELLDRIILAELPGAMGEIVARIEDETAVSSDVPGMMAALPPLARITRYGSVRRTEQTAVRAVVDSLITRICIGLPSTCAGMDDDAAGEMAGHFTAVTGVIHTLRAETQAAQWHEALRATLVQPDLHGLLGGRACRLLFDDEALRSEEAARLMEQALRRSTTAVLSVEQAAQSAAWLEGFLAGGELLLIHDRRLWGLLDGWLNELPPERFVDILPLLRRTFARFSAAARRQLQERVVLGVEARAQEMPVAAVFDHEQARAVLPLLRQLLGLEEE